MTASAHLLIVSGEPVARCLYRESLEVAGYQLSSASDEEQALLWLHGSTPDLVLLDLSPPEIDGLSVLEAMRDSGFDLAVVILTTEEKVADAVAAMKLGAVDVLTKPLAPARLRAVVGEILTRRKTSDTQQSNPVVLTPREAFAASLDRAKLALRHRKFEEAEVFLRQAIALEGGSAEAHNLLGVVHEIRNHPRDAYWEYLAALKADRRYGPARNNVRRLARRSLWGRSAEPLDTGGLRIEGGTGGYQAAVIRNRVRNNEAE